MVHEHYWVTETHLTFGITHKMILGSLQEMCTIVGSYTECLMILRTENSVVHTVFFCDVTENSLFSVRHGRKRRLHGRYLPCLRTENSAV